MKFKQRMSIVLEDDIWMWPSATARTEISGGLGVSTLYSLQASFNKIKGYLVSWITGFYCGQKYPHVCQSVTCHRPAPLTPGVNRERVIILRAPHLPFLNGPYVLFHSIAAQRGTLEGNEARPKETGSPHLTALVRIPPTAEGTNSSS